MVEGLTIDLENLEIRENYKIIKIQSLVRRFLINNISINNPVLKKKLQQKLKWWHSGMRHPLKDIYWEDIWDQCINSNNSNWIGGGHQPGADTVHYKTGIEYQNKSGIINNKGMVSITSHRLAKDAGPTFEDKLNFISSKKWDKYILLSRKEKEWKEGKKIYYLMIFDNKLLNFKELEWEKHIPTKGKNKGKHNGGYIGKGDEQKFSAKIDGPGSSNQLHITINIDYIGGYHKFIISQQIHHFE